MWGNVEHRQYVESEITAWLRGEHEYQFNKNRVTHNAVPQLSIDHIVTQELESKWQHFQLFDSAASDHEDDLMHLQANQRLLKTCAGARAALYWSYVWENKTAEVANAQTWEVLATHYERLRNDPSQYPEADMAHAPLAAVVHPAELVDGQDTANLTTIFEKIAGIALIHLSFKNSFVLPMPGTRSGEIVIAS